MNPVKVFVESGRKRIFVGAVDWPGWCRSAQDEQTAIQALVDYGPRYARVLHDREIEFRPPMNASDLTVIERHDGNATTDFGAPAVILDADRASIDPAELERLQMVLQACWQTFDRAMQQATDRELRKGPRGGGRDAAAILEHVLAADQEYLARLAWKHKRESEKNPLDQLVQMRRAILNALEAAANGALPEKGPRGGTLWPPAYFIRRVAWHVLDHAWEIEDRVV
ncbi:MAG: DinB family protein [Anaerolineales bacterium]